jgi:regulator of protease activity HflC (stomatin/prohibitin superfamily)
MPWLFVFFIVFTVIAVPVFFGGRKLARSGSADDRESGAGGVVVGGILGVVAAIFLILSLTTIVSTRNVGIVTSFGKPVGTLSNGLHLKWPWQHVPELNGTIQTDSQTGAFDGAKCSGGTPVRLANNSTACVDNTIRWRINPSAGDSLYRDYLDDKNIRESLVTRELNATLNAVFNAYNPLAPDAQNGPNLTDLSTQVTKKLQTQIGGQIEVQNVIISIVHFDQQTQDKINAYQAQIANTRIAEESQKTAQAQAEANRILASSVSGDINLQVARCLDIYNSGKVPNPIPCIPGAGQPFTIPAR